MSISVLLADDEPLIRGGIAMLLSAEPDVVVIGEAGNGGDAVDQARALRPDVILMDVRMPEVDGIEATCRLTAESATAGSEGLSKVLILTTFNEDEAVYAALRAGARGVLLKHASPSDLVAAVKVVAAGAAWLHPSVARKLLDEFAARPDPKLPEPAALERLTPRETEVLALIARGGRSNAAVARELYVGEATVKTHLNRAMTKLGLRDRAQAVSFAYECGLIRPDLHLRR